MLSRALPLIALSCALLGQEGGALVSNAPLGRLLLPTLLAAEDDSNSMVTTAEERPFLESLNANLRMRLRIAQESTQQGYDFKQVLANVLAGDYDADAVNAQLDEDIRSAPCVMFTWKRSPSCVKAIQAFELMKIVDQVKLVPLDDPWDEGNPKRAELGKRLGRTSVPTIFIGGEYVGGFDGGISDQAPGIQTLAFQGTLRPALEAAGIVFDN